MGVGQVYAWRKRLELMFSIGGKLSENMSFGSKRGIS